MTAFEDWSSFVEATSWWTVEVHPLLLAMFLFSSTERVGTFHWIIFSKYVSKNATTLLERTSCLHHMDSNHTIHFRHLWRRQSQRYVFRPKLEDTRHDDVPSAAAGSECIVPARDIIASNFLHNINILPFNHFLSLRTPHTHLHYLPRTCIPHQTNKPQTWPKRVQQSRLRRRAPGPPF